MKDGKMRDVADICGIPVYCRYDDAVEIEKVTGHPRNPNRNAWRPSKPALPHSSQDQLAPLRTKNTARGMEKITHA